MICRAELKGDYQKKRSYLESVYAKTDANGNILKDANGNTVWIRDDVNIDAEVTADLVGDYLFTDEDFIRNLSAKHQNLFQKVYAEIKYLLKTATAGSTEARKLEKVKKMFDKAYRESTEAQKNTTEDGGVRYSLDNTTFDGDFDYSGLNWASDIGIISKKDIAIFTRTINNEILRGAEPQSANGEYIIDTGRCLMFSDGNFHSPTLSRVITFEAEHESLLDEAKRRILYEARSTGDVQESKQAIEDLYGPGFAVEYTQTVYGTDARQNRGRKRSNGSGSNQKVRSLRAEFEARGLGHLFEDNQHDYSLSTPAEDIAPVGNFNIHGWDIADIDAPIRGDINVGGQLPDVRESAESGIRDQLRSSQDALNEMGTVTDIYVPEEYRLLDVAGKKNWVVDKLHQTGYKVDRKGFGVIEFARKQLKSAFNYFKKGSVEETAFEALPAVLENGIEISARTQHKGRDYGTVTIAAPITINGKRGNMAVVVKQTTGNYYKVHRILTPDGSEFILPETTNEAESTPAGESPINGSLATPKDSASEDIIIDGREDVNTEVTSDEDVSEKIRIKIQNLQTELDNNQRLREESSADYEAEIARLQSEYEAKMLKQHIKEGLFYHRTSLLSYAFSLFSSSCLAIS